MYKHYSRFKAGKTLRTGPIISLVGALIVLGYVLILPW